MRQPQPAQLAALFEIQPDALQGLQRGTQHMPLGSLHATCDQADAAVRFAHHLDQQAGFPPRPGVQHEGVFVGDAHRTDQGRWA